MTLDDVRIETDHLVLRELTDDDFDSVHVYASDPDVVKLLSWGPNSEDDTRAFLRQAAEERKVDPRASYRLGVVSTEEDKLIGACHLVIPVATERVGRITYVLNKDYWRRGFMGEAVRGILKFGFCWVLFFSGGS